MRESRCEEMKRYIGFSEEDEANLHALGAQLKPAIPAIVERFYRELLQNENARAVLTGGQEQVERLRGTLIDWLHELFDDEYEDAYYEKRRQVGRTHVRVGLPQHFMFLGMELVWQEFQRQILSVSPDRETVKMGSLHKLLMFDLAVMLESYKDNYSDRIRAVERSSMEEKLTRAVHLAKIGQLAASLAHEIKNPLAGISGAIQIIRDEFPESDPHQPILTEVLGQIGRLDATVKDLLQYARPLPPRESKFAIDSVITRVLTVLHEEPALQKVQIQYSQPASETVVYADDRQLEQLVMNLLINAAHASSEGDTLYLTVGRNDMGILMVVKDYGKGMSSEERDKAFEAFFTTKARGTGLGLPICRRIAEAHGGHIEIESELGRGTTVTVTLPITTSNHNTKGDS